MLPKKPRPMRHRCDCGGRLRWERRETWRGIRFLGVCSRSECGRYTTSIADGDEHPDGLAGFLLGDAMIRPATPPQLRLVLRYPTAGWKHHPEACWNCEDELTLAVDFTRSGPPAEHLAHAAVCLPCGAVQTESWFYGEVLQLDVAPEAWKEFSPSIITLKRALAQHTEPESPPDWSFGDLGA